MSDENERIHLNEVDAKSARRVKGMPYVLGVSLVAIIFIVFIVYGIFAA